MFTWFESIESLVGASDTFVIVYGKGCTSYAKEVILGLLGSYCETHSALDDTVLVVRVVKEYPPKEVIRWIKALAAVPIPTKALCMCTPPNGEHVLDCPLYVPF